VLVAGLRPSPDEEVELAVALRDQHAEDPDPGPAMIG